MLGGFVARTGNPTCGERELGVLFVSASLRHSVTGISASQVGARPHCAVVVQLELGTPKEVPRPREPRKLPMEAPIGCCGPESQLHLHRRAFITGVWSEEHSDRYRKWRQLAAHVEEAVLNVAGVAGSDKDG